MHTNLEYHHYFTVKIKLLNYQYAIVVNNSLKAIYTKYKL